MRNVNFLKPLLAAVVLAALLYSNTVFAGGAAANRGPFSLVTHKGEKVTDQSFLGQYMLVFFGYTHCPDVCPTDLQVISEAMDMLGKDASKIQPLFITLDPERDTEKVMAEYVQHFHPKLIGLTGTNKQTKAAADVYRIQKRIYYPPDGGKKDYLLDHSAAIILVGPDGGGLSMFPHGITPEDIVEDIRGYLK